MMGNWPCFSTSGVNDLASGVAGSWIFIPMKLFTVLFRPSHHWASLNSVLSLPLMENAETGVGNIPLILSVLTSPTLCASQACGGCLWYVSSTFIAAPR